MTKFITRLASANLKKDSKGFSLVELIVVIVILGVLVGIAVPSMTGYIERAKEAKDRANVESVEKAFMLAITSQSVTISPGVITYKADGTMNGIGVTLTEQFAQIFGASGKTAGVGQKGYKMPALQSKKYRNAEPKFDFKWSDASQSYIVLTYQNRID